MVFLILLANIALCILTNFRSMEKGELSFIKKISNWVAFLRNEIIDWRYYKF